MEANLSRIGGNPLQNFLSAGATSNFGGWKLIFGDEFIQDRGEPLAKFSFHRCNQSILVAGKQILEANSSRIGRNPLQNFSLTSASDYVSGWRLIFGVVASAF